MIEQDPSHQFGRDGEEMRAVIPAYSVLIHESKIGLMDKGRGLDRPSATLASHVAIGHAPQLSVDEGHQSVAGGRVALAPGEQKLRYSLGRRSCHEASADYSLNRGESIFVRLRGREKKLAAVAANGFRVPPLGGLRDS